MNEMDLIIINFDNVKLLSMKIFFKVDYMLFMVGNIGYVGCDYVVFGFKEIKVVGGNIKLCY